MGTLKALLATCLSALLLLLDRGHVYLQAYKVIAVAIIVFVMWQCHTLTLWWMAHAFQMEDWQNAALVGVVVNYSGILLACLNHILKPPGGPNA